MRFALSRGQGMFQGAGWQTLRLPAAAANYGFSRCKNLLAPNRSLKVCSPLCWLAAATQGEPPPSRCRPKLRCDLVVVGNVRRFVRRRKLRVHPGNHTRVNGGSLRDKTPAAQRPVPLVTLFGCVPVALRPKLQQPPESAERSVYHARRVGLGKRRVRDAEDTLLLSRIQAQAGGSRLVQHPLQSDLGQ